MPRNIDRRVEVLFPIEDPILKQEIIENILDVYLKDTSKSYQLGPGGKYSRVAEQIEGEIELFSSQDYLLNGRISLQQPSDSATEKTEAEMATQN